MDEMKELKAQFGELVLQAEMIEHRKMQIKQRIVNLTQQQQIKPAPAPVEKKNDTRSV